jgi:acetyl esterase/lipase
MSKHQREAIDQMLRAAPLDLGGDVAEQRAIFAQLMTAVPMAVDVRTEDGTLGGVPVVTVAIDGIDPVGTILHLHGGAYVIGSARLSVRLASELARRSGTRAVSVDYSLAPESPYPRAVHDVVDAYRALVDGGVPASEIVLAGESAGGGLALSAALAIKDGGLPMPAGIYVASPWADLTLSGESVTTKADVDPSVDPIGLARRVRDYLGDGDPADTHVSTVFADLVGLPPLLIQVGANEVLLDDSTRLAARAAADGVDVTLDVTPDVPHVFVGFTGMLDEADRAVAAAARFIQGAVMSKTGES